MFLGWFVLGPGPLPARAALGAGAGGQGVTGELDPRLPLAGPEVGVDLPASVTETVRGVAHHRSGSLLRRHAPAAGVLPASGAWEDGGRVVARSEVGKFLPVGGQSLPEFLVEHHAGLDVREFFQGVRGHGRYPFVH
ncbi:gp82 [Rhodococcus phage ReqiPine5]|uniref:Gp82 n=1 Tax=Rhodococcus phage ReqiPine5 TaxID=691963 RepID=D4P857_9CAUD|nr:gp82 [Rhodococcus phage ReqiPine5]ADD81187.1 gp82 [Rhodococcus phage ReqiPine5]